MELAYTLKDYTYIVIILGILTTLIFALIRFKPKALFLLFYFIIVLVLYFKFTDIFINQIALYLILPSLVIGGLAGAFTYPEKKDEIWDVEIEATKGRKLIKNLRRGVLILGSAGSGKTESPIFSIMKHLAAADYGGIIYDYKDGELSEMAKPLFGERLKIIAIHKPYLGSRINPLSEKYITDEKDINEIVNVLIDNLGAGDIFFYNF